MTELLAQHVAELRRVEQADWQFQTSDLRLWLSRHGYIESLCVSTKPISYVLTPKGREALK